MKNSTKRFAMCLLVMMGLATYSQAQTITAYRYWFDNTVSTATSVSVTAGANLNVSAAIATNSLSNGYHTISMQFQDANGAYSSPITRTFVRTGFNIIAYEYWWDANYANHVTVATSAAQNINVSAVVTPYGLDTGLHLFAFRFQDANGNWSAPVQDTVRNTVNRVGIREISSLSNISLFPNPTQSGSLLRFSGNGNEVLSLVITDTWGNTVQQQQLQNGFAPQEYQVNTDNLAAGVYYVKLSSQNGSATRKLVVE